MTVVILNSDNLERAINHFVAYGFDSFIVFASNQVDIDVSYYKLNDIKITVLDSVDLEGNLDKLKKIRGSLKNRFFAVFSTSICCFDVDRIVSSHMKSQKTVTLVEASKRLCAFLAEEELFDYLYKAENSENGVFTALGENEEINAFN